MPRRNQDLINGEFYHIFNKTIDRKVVFDDSRSLNILKVIKYYRSTQSNKLSYSDFLKLDTYNKDLFWSKILNEKTYQFRIYAYCFMPTHFHLLVRQTKDNGIVKGFSNVLNSFVKHYNKVYERTGPLFLPRFKAVPIRSEEQLKHVFRYILLNPYSSSLVKLIPDIFNYPLSAAVEYFGHRKDICDTDYIVELFNNQGEGLKKFIEDNADYQKTLEEIKHVKKFC